MPTTDKELAEKAEHVQKLRDQVAAATAQRVSRESELSNDIAMAQLDAEEARLQAQLAAAKEGSKVAAVKAGAATVLDVLKEDQSNAEAMVKAQEAAAAASAAPKSADNDADTPKEV